MVNRRSHVNKRNRVDNVPAVEIAVAVIEGRTNPLDDPELAAVDPAPVSLGLPDEFIVIGTQSSALSDKLGNFEE